MTLRDIPDDEIRLGVGKVNFTYDKSNEWYVTRYSRNLVNDRALGWFPTFTEAIQYADKLAREPK